MDYPFTMRRASLADRTAVTELCAAIAPDDWVPYVYDHLVSEPEPEGLYVAERDDRIIGCYHLALPAPGEAYFSAMRIHPETQGQGFGSLYCRAQVEQARSVGAGAIYLLSVTENRPAHRTVQKNGFTNLGEWLVYDKLTAAPLRGLHRRARPAQPVDQERVQAFVSRLGPEGTASVVSEPRSAWSVRSVRADDWDPSQLVVVDHPEELAGLMLLSDTREGLLVRRLEGTSEAAADLLEFAWSERTRRGHKALRISLPSASEPLLRPLGLDPGAAFRAYVFYLSASTELPTV